MDEQEFVPLVPRLFRGRPPVEPQTSTPVESGGGPPGNILDLEVAKARPNQAGAAPNLPTKAAHAETSEPVPSTEPIDVKDAEPEQLEDDERGHLDDAEATGSTDGANNLAPSEPHTFTQTFDTALKNALAYAARQAEIRNEAVRLTCIATARILRHAVAFDPKVIARFVEDALNAAREPDAPVKVNGKHLAALGQRGSQCKPDERLALGEVVVEVPAGSVSATLEDRAALGAAAAAALDLGMPHKHE